MHMRCNRQKADVEWDQLRYLFHMVSVGCRYFNTEIHHGVRYFQILWLCFHDLDSKHQLIRCGFTFRCIVNLESQPRAFSNQLAISFCAFLEIISRTIDKNQLWYEMVVKI